MPAALAAPPLGLRLADILKRAPLARRSTRTRLQEQAESSLIYYNSTLCCSCLASTCRKRKIMYLYHTFTVHMEVIKNDESSYLHPSQHR